MGKNKKLTGVGCFWYIHYENGLGKLIPSKVRTFGKGLVGGMLDYSKMISMGYIIIIDKPF